MNIHLREPTAAEVEIEQATLALLLEGSETAWLVLDRISTEDMLEPLHQRVVEAVRGILDAGGEPSPLTTAAAMASDVGLNTVGGANYLRHIRDQFGGNRKIAKEICDSLVDQSQRRALAREIAQTEARLHDPMVPAREVLGEHEAAVRALAEGRPRPDDPMSWYDVGARVIERLSQPKEMQESLIPFGIDALDDAIGGMGKGDLIIMAARPAMGKTALALSIAHSVAKEREQISLDLTEERPPIAGLGVFMSSLEMKQDALLERGLSMRAYQKGIKVPYQSIRLSRLKDDNIDGLIDALARDTHMPFVIDQRRGQTVSQIGVRARRAQAKMAREGRKLGLVVVDHLGLIQADGNYGGGNRVAEITAMTGGLKTMAGLLDVPVVVLCQLSRKVEEREDKRPFLSDLRDSGSIEQDADIVMLLHRPEYYLLKSKPDPSAADSKKATWEALLERSRDKMEIHIAKNRHGAEADITVKCDLAYNWIGERV